MSSTPAGGNVIVHADFLDDLRIQMLAELRSAGYAIPKRWPRKPIEGAPPALAFDSTSARDVSLLYYNVRHRLVPVAVRSIAHSREFSAEASVLGDQTRLALLEIQRRSLAGESLLPFLHRALTSSPGFHDGLLNDWGIHHLHLGGIGPEPDGYMPRSASVLCLMVRPERLYFIRVHPHQAWSEQSLIEIVHSNWPDVLASYRALGVSMAGTAATADERRLARAAGVVTLTVMADGTVYTPPGGGYSTSGHSSRVVSRSGRLLERAFAAQRDVEERSAEYAREIQRVSGLALPELHFVLEKEDNDGLVFTETQSMVRFPVDRLATS